VQTGRGIAAKVCCVQSAHLIGLVSPTLSLSRADLAGVRAAHVPAGVRRVLPLAVAGPAVPDVRAAREAGAAPAGQSAPG